jgi:hypothetical protein
MPAPICASLRVAWLPAAPKGQGTKCLATIVLSLRDENHSSIEAPRIKLALIGLNPQAESV